VLVGFGAAFAGFKGIGDAVTAMGDKTAAAGAKMKVSADAVRAATEAVAAAQRGYRDSLDAVQKAGRDLAAAQRGVVSAQQDAARAAVGGHRGAEGLPAAASGT
jgi:hypothetical protein